MGAGEEMGLIIGPGGVSGREAGGLGSEAGPGGFCHEVGITGIEREFTVKLALLSYLTRRHVKGSLANSLAS